MNGVVVDTSVWIDFFAGRSVPRLEESLAEGVVILPPLVVAELVSGASSVRDQASVAALLRELAVHETPLEHWIRVGGLRRKLAAHGVSVSTPDAHVAQCALERSALLLARDRVFPRIADHTALRLSTG